MRVREIRHPPRTVQARQAYFKNMMLALLIAAGLAAPPAVAASLAPPMTAPPAAPPTTAPSVAPPIRWERFSDQIFARAKAEHRLVLIDLEAVWCHFCHVMDDQTYAAPAVRALVAEKYLAVRVDQDADPALSKRYERWGWPATIVLAANGSEIVKRRGFIPPERMVALLRAIIDDPSPGPSVQLEPALAPASSEVLTALQREGLRAQLIDAYDAQFGGFGQTHKLLEAAPIEAAIALSQGGDKRFEEMARKTLDASLQLLDPEWGGIYQYSVAIDWKSPHFEKIMPSQTEALRMFALGYALWHDDKYLAATQGISRYLAAFLTDPSGAFRTSQDADLSRDFDGHRFYRLSDAERRKLGRAPRVDEHLYARENGLAIAALAELYQRTGDASALARAVRAARWVLAKRALPGGGFGHGEAKEPPALSDTLAMGRAFLSLYVATADREWLGHADQAARFIEGQFRSANGFLSSTAVGVGVFARPVADVDENAELARFANLLARYSGSAQDRALARHALRFCAAAASQERPMPELLLADLESSAEPLHLTVVGAKGDAAAGALFAAALAVPKTYARVEWWDPSEGPLPNADVPLPQTGRPAAFVCTGSACSLPLHDPARIAPAALR